MLSHLIINPLLRMGEVTVEEFNTHQWTVYQQSYIMPLFIPYTPGEPPTVLNWTSLMHILNFFKFHMQSIQGVLHIPFQRVRLQHHLRKAWSPSLLNITNETRPLNWNWLTGLGEIPFLPLCFSICESTG